jgi:hypothetical protein
LLTAILVRSVVQPCKHSVYPIFANAAREWCAGIDPYDRTIPRGDLDKFRYAPIVAATFVPLGQLPDAAGGVLWRIINGSIFFAGMIVFVRTVFPRRERLDHRGVAILAWSLLILGLGSLNNSQANSLCAGCLLLGGAAILRRRWNWAAVCLAVPVLFKVYPIAVVMLYFLMRPARPELEHGTANPPRRWRDFVFVPLGWRMVVALVGGLMLPFVLQEPVYVAQAYHSWVDQVSHDNRRDYPLHVSYRDFHTLTRFTGFPMDDGPYTALQVAMAGLVAGFVLRARLQDWPAALQIRAAFELGCCWIILFGPATENATYTVLAPTLALATWEALQPGQPSWIRRPMLGIVPFFVVASSVTIFPFGRSLSFWLMPSGALMLFVQRLAAYWSTRRPAAPVQPLTTTRPLAA